MARSILSAHQGFFTWPIAQWKIKHCDGTGETNGTNDRVEKPCFFFFWGFVFGLPKLEDSHSNLQVAVSPLADFRWNGGIHLCQG